MNSATVEYICFPDLSGNILESSTIKGNFHDPESRGHTFYHVWTVLIVQIVNIQLLLHGSFSWVKLTEKERRIFYFALNLFTRSTQPINENNICQDFFSRFCKASHCLLFFSLQDQSFCTVKLSRTQGTVPGQGSLSNRHTS